MTVKPGSGPGNGPEMQAGNSPADLKYPRIIAYNLRKGERPGGMKARYKVKIETGRKARELDERQAEVIRDLLHWARQHRARRPGT
jgi:hypothetical protein